MRIEVGRKAKLKDETRLGRICEIRRDPKGKLIYAKVKMPSRMVRVEEADIVRTEG